MVHPIDVYFSLVHLRVSDSQIPLVIHEPFTMSPLKIIDIHRSKCFIYLQLAGTLIQYFSGKLTTYKANAVNAKTREAGFCRIGRTETMFIKQ